jgi:hypothetical protein
MLSARAGGDRSSFDEVTKTVLSLCSSPVEGRSSKQKTTRERSNSSKRARSK